MGIRTVNHDLVNGVKMELLEVDLINDLKWNLITLALDVVGIESINS